MAHLQYMPGDPRLVDQLVYELKSKGIFDQFRKECIADVDTRPAYQNLRQRVENSVSTFLSRQTWQPDLNKNQLREKLRKHILDGNYLEQGVERIVDQVVNPKVASVFIPKVEDLVYNYLGIARKKTVTAETSNGKVDDLLPTDLEAVSPGSVKSNDDKNDSMEVDDDVPGECNMDVDEEKSTSDVKENNITSEIPKEEKAEDIQLPSSQPLDVDKSNIPLPSEEIKPENIPPPDNSPPKVELEKIELPKEPIISTDIPLPDDVSKEEKEQFFKPINSDDDDSSSDSSLRRNMSPLTPIRNFNNENSCDAQQAFENDLIDSKNDDKKEPSSFKFAIDAKSPENSSDVVKPEKKDTESNLSYQFNNQVNINNFNTPLYEDSSNSNNLHIDYESDANSKINQENKVSENDQNSEDSRKDRKPDEKKSSHKSSHRSRDYSKHSSSRDKKSDSSKQSSSRDSSRHDKSKSSREESKSKSNDKDRSRDRSDKKDSRESSRHRSSHKSSHKDSKSHRSSSSSHRHSSKHSDEKKSSSSSSSNQKDKDKSSDKSSMDKPKESKSSSHRSDKDRKSSSSSGKSDKSSSKSKSDDKDKNKKSKKETDDHYSLSGRGNPNRRSTDRDSNDGSSSSKGSHPSSSKTSEAKKDSKSSSKSETTSTSGDSTSPSDKENVVQEHGTIIKESLQHKPIVRIESHLEQPVLSPPRLPFVPDITIKKPKFAANLEEAKRLMKMRKFLDEEQKRMNQEAALLLEFQANVRPSLSQVYSRIPGPELEFACVTNAGHNQELVVQSNENMSNNLTVENIQESHYTSNQLLNVLNDASVEVEKNATNDVQSDSVNNTEEVNDLVVSPENDEEIHDCNAENTNVKNEFSNEDNKTELESLDSEQNETLNDSQTDVITTDNATKSFESLPVEKNRVKLFEVTVIAEEVSESEEMQNDEITDNENSNDNRSEQFKINEKSESNISDENKFHYFAEHEKYNAEIERARFSKFLKDFNIKSSISNKIYLINCDSYEENLIRETSKNFGEYEIVNYHRNGHLKLPKTKNVIKNVNISSEISLPIDSDYETANDYESFKSHVFSPDKSECSFELSSDYNAKLEEMVNKTSRQEIMEIILGNVVDSPSKMPRIDYLTDSNIDSECENNLKRKISDVETTVNNNRHVLTPNKIRKLSTEQISSTTQENEEITNHKTVNSTRSKYLGKARRVGLPRPRRSGLPNSPSSDKSVENYEDNTQTPQTPNGKIKRSKVQRYDTSDLYKPKLHFLSRRNHIT